MSNVTLFPTIMYVWPLLCIVVLFESLAIYLFKYRSIPGAKPLIANFTIKAILVLSWVLCSVSTALPFKLFWAYVSQCMLVLTISSWFEFLLAVSGIRGKLPRLIRYGIQAIIVCLLLLIMLDSQLNYYWKSYSFDGRTLRLCIGPMGWITMGFCYATYLVSVGISLYWIATVRGLRRRQAILISLSPLFTIVGQLLGRVPGAQVFAPQLLGLVLGVAYLGWFFIRWRIYSILPMARDAVTRSMVDALLVVDEEGYIVELNPTARALFGSSLAMVGETFTGVATAWPDLARFDADPQLLQLETWHEFSEGRRCFQVDTIPLAVGNSPMGRVFVLKDITRRKQDKATMIEQQKALSMLAERDRIGRELHDTQGQFPGYVKAQAQAVRLLMNKQRPADAAALLEQLIAAADAECITIREAVACLKNATVDWDFFRKLAEWLKRFEQMSGIAVDYDGPLETSLPWVAPEAEVHLLRIIQEALTNARKHASPSRVAITITRSDTLLTLTVADNGHGFDAARIATGFGLDIIRERSSEINGTCSIYSTPGSGTTVTVQVPLRSCSRDAAYYATAVHTKESSP